MRILRVTGVAVVVIVLSAGPVAAKIDLRSVTVRGPGIDEPIVLTGDDAWTLLVGGGDGPEHPPRAARPPALEGALGSEYTLTLDLGMSGERTLRLYPFADGEPILWFGHGRTLRWVIEWSERPSHTGWIEVAGLQLQVLHDAGFPKKSPVTEPEPWAPVAAEPGTADVATTPASSEQARAGMAIMLGVAAAVLILGSLILRAEIRRRARV